MEIPKPSGGKRLLGIPSVVDRMIQQAIAQVLSPIYERQFSEHSYGFRPGKSAKQAVLKGKEYIEAGYTWTVDIDLAKYFDTVNHAKLMRLLSATIKDSRVLSFKWKKLRTKHDNLVKLGIENHKAWEYANTRKSYWRSANSPILNKTLTTEHLRKIGFITVAQRYSLVH